MTKDEALDLALEALEILKRAFFKSASTPEEIEQGCDKGYEDYEAEWVEPALKAITAIKQALSAPVQNAKWKAKQKSLAAQAIKCATEAIEDADGPIKAVREYYGAQPAPVQPVISAGLITPAMQAGPTLEQKEQMVRAMQSAYPTAQPAPVQEPVATKLETQQFNCFHVSAEDFQRLKALPVGTKLYTTPPAAQRQWVGLTHEEVMDSWDEIRDGDWAPDFYAVIESKLKDKNG